MNFRQTIKKTLLACMIILLSLPMLQHLLGLCDSQPLRGDIRDVPFPVLSMESWLNGSHARKMDEYLTHNFGFREGFVRVDNQLAYAVFGEARAKNIVIGKDEFLFEKNYLDAYAGRDFLGRDIIREKVRRLKFIQEKMEEENKVFLTVLAAGKATFYPEYIPNEWQEEKDSTNYHVYRKELSEQGVNHIDFNAWFVRNKGKWDYPLYPKTGIHWSEYGMALAADSILTWIDNARDWDLPEIYWDSIIVSDSIRYSDSDIEDGMNLLYGISNIPMAYPQIKFRTEGKKKAKAIVISDSFFWRMYSAGVPTEFFDNAEFWYYFYGAYPRYAEDKTRVEDLNLENELPNKEVVIMMGTEAFLRDFPWGAEQRLYEYYNGTYSFDALRLESKLSQMKERIQKDKEWLGHLKDKARKEGISLDSMIHKDALSIVEKELGIK